MRCEATYSSRKCPACVLLQGAVSSRHSTEKISYESYRTTANTHVYVLEVAKTALIVITAAPPSAFHSFPVDCVLRQAGFASPAPLSNPFGERSFLQSSITFPRFITKGITSRLELDRRALAVVVQPTSVRRRVRVVVMTSTCIASPGSVFQLAHTLYTQSA